jgi:hypothetical protein
VAALGKPGVPGRRFSRFLELEILQADVVSHSAGEPQTRILAGTSLSSELANRTKTKILVPLRFLFASLGRFKLA